MSDLNEALLQEAAAEENPTEKEDEPKRNTKDDLVGKIISVCADNDLELEYSNSKLKRMTKQQLCKILAEKIEFGVKAQMAKQVGAKPGAADSVIALGALKMMHNICASSCERGLNLFLPNYGYEVQGFTEALKDPNVDEAVTQCLHEIALESDVMQYIESPYVRLAIAWGGALVTTIRKKPRRVNRTTYYATPMGPRPSPTEDSVQLSVDRRPPARKVDRRERPRVEDEKQV